MRMAAVGSIIPNYMAAPQGVGYSDKAVKPQDLGVWETFPDDWPHVGGYF